MIRSAISYIGKIIRSAVVLTTTTVFLLSGLMLCCQVNVAHAEQLKAKTASCCHVSKTNHFKEHDSKSCRCCKISKDSPDKANESFEITQTSNKSFHNIFLSVDRLVNVMHHRASLALAYQGPPRANRSLPIYLQLSNLRL